MTKARPRVGLLVTHPIQYYAPWYRALANEVDLEVFFSHRQTPAGQASAGFGVAFEWDVPVCEGYPHTFLRNVAARPDVGTFWGCRTPDLARIIHERAFDAFIVHGWSTASYWQAMIACWRTDTPLLVRGDSALSVPKAWWWRVAKYPFYRAFISRFDGYLIVGRRALEYVLHYGARPDRCFPAPHSVDNAFFAAEAARLDGHRAVLRARFSLPERAVVFLFAGRLIDRKRPDLFINAIARAAAAHPHVAGLVVGDGSMREALVRYAAEHHVPVSFAGFLNQREIAEAYVASDVLTVPSTWETWGLVVNEAMACGRTAIVSSGVACVGDLVIDGETGDVFPVGDEHALAAAMIRLAGDPARLRRLSEGALDRVRAFDISETVRGTLRAVEAVGRHRGSRHQHALNDQDGRA